MRLTLFARLLLDPTAADGGGAPAAPPAAAPAPAPAAAADAATKHRTITADELQRLLEIENQYLLGQQTQAAELDRKEQARLRALAEKGQVEEALAQQRKGWESKYSESEKRYQDLEREVLSDRRANVLESAFAGRQFAGETDDDRASAAEDLRRLLAPEFEAVRRDGRIDVRHKATGRPAAEVLKEVLDGRRYARYFASKGGGSGSNPAGGSPPPANPAGGDDFLARNAREFAARQAAGGWGLHRTG